MAAPASSAPGRSSRRVPPAPERPAGSVRAPSISAASPTGTFTKKIIRQPVPSTLTLIKPPAAIGPSIADRPITGP
jgi:hypothetical protein